MDVFELKSGRFTPLADDALATLSESQAKAYGELKSAVEAQASADAEIENARTHNTACVEALRFAEENAPKPPSFLDLWRASKRI